MRLRTPGGVALVGALMMAMAGPLLGAVLLLSAGPLFAEPYVAPPSGIRWNDVGGIRWNDVGGIRWDDVGGIRWNDVGGIRWNDVGGTLFTEASGIRWNDVGGIRWNDVGGIDFIDPLPGQASLGLDVLSLLSPLPDSSAINVIVTFVSYPTPLDLAALNAIGIPGGTLYRRLPMVVVNATRPQIAAMSHMAAVRSIFANRTTSFFDQESGALIGLDEAQTDPALRVGGGGGLPFSGAGVTIAVLDTGVDATHPDLPYGTKVLENVRLTGATGSGIGFTAPARVEGVTNTDLVLGHGTFVASVAAGTGQASGGLYKGVAPGASILSLSAGDVFILNMLEGFDYILENRVRFGVKVVNCSWGTEGFFDPDDPINIATRILHDAGVTVVFAAGNHGPSPDTLNPYSLAPWVIGVGSTRKDGALSDFSSRGIFEELLYHPTLVAPGEGIVAASPVAINAVYGVTGVAGPPPPVAIPPAYAPWYTVSSGTSFAAPHVAALAALMLQADPSLTPDAIKRRLQETATPILEHDRSEAGAGRLDAWAALTQSVDSSRPFGTHVPGWMDERPWRIDYVAPPPQTGTLPAGGTLQVPFSLQGAVVSWSASLAWGTVPGLSDLDVRLLDAQGREMSRSQSINGLALFGRTEGSHLMGAVPRGFTMEIAFKPPTGPLDQPFWLSQESAVATVPDFTDLGGLGTSNRDRVALAVGSRIMAGRGDRFEPFQPLTRAELARALALVASVPQRIPDHASFGDTGTSDPFFPYVETVAGDRARRHLIDPRSPGSFGGGAAVTRLDYVVAVVRAAGLESQALSRQGEELYLADETKIPSELRGYVAVALESRLIAKVPAGGGGWRFCPNGSVSRLTAAQYLPQILFNLPTSRLTSDSTAN